MNFLQGKLQDRGDWFCGIQPIVLRRIVMDRGNLDGERIELEVFDNIEPEVKRPEPASDSGFIQMEEMAGEPVPEEVPEVQAFEPETAVSVEEMTVQKEQVVETADAPVPEEAAEDVSEMAVEAEAVEPTFVSEPENEPDAGDVSYPEEEPAAEAVREEIPDAGQMPETEIPSFTKPETETPIPPFTGSLDTGKKKKKGFNPMFIIIPVIVLIIAGFAGFSFYKAWATDVLSVDGSSSIRLYVGEKKTLSVKSEKRRVYDFEYTSSSPSNIKVDKNGVITAEKPGSATITIDAGKRYVEPITATVSASYKPVAVKNGQMIKTAKGSKVAKVELTNASSKDAYFYFRNTKTKKNDFAMYLKKGKKKTIKAPYGTYEIFYATGNTWYGPKILFGPGGSTYKEPKKAKLYRKGNMIYGIRYRIYNIYSGGAGNPSQSIPSNSFPH